MLGLITKPLTEVYTETGPDSFVSDELFYGHFINIIDINDKFYYIKTHYDYYGYVHKNDVTILRDKRYSPEHVVRKNYTDILSEPTYESSIIISLPKCSRIYVKNVVNEDWSKVILHNNKVGYIRNLDYKQRNTEKPNRETIIQNALDLLGTNYRWGGKSILGIDCSGLTHISYMLEERIFFRDSGITNEILNQYNMKQVTRKEMKPGDMIYIKGHVMMYLGEDQYIHASQTYGKVVINSLNKDHDNYFSYIDELEKNYISVLDD